MNTMIRLKRRIPFALTAPNDLTGVPNSASTPTNRYSRTGNNSRDSAEQLSIFSICCGVDVPTHSRLPHDSPMEANKRLLFWLRIPYVADVALLAIGVALLVTGQPAGWWVLVFAFVRAIIGTIALVIVAPRIITRRR